MTLPEAVTLRAAALIGEAIKAGYIKGGLAVNLDRVYARLADLDAPASTDAEIVDTALGLMEVNGIVDVTAMRKILTVTQRERVER